MCLVCRLQSHPLLANDRAAPLHGDPVLVVSRRTVNRRVAREMEATTFDDKIVVIAGRGCD